MEICFHCLKYTTETYFCCGILVQKKIKMEICLCNKIETYLCFYFFCSPIYYNGNIVPLYILYNINIFLLEGHFGEKLKHVGGENSNCLYFTSCIY